MRETEQKKDGENWRNDHLAGGAAAEKAERGGAGLAERADGGGKEGDTTPELDKATLPKPEYMPSAAELDRMQKEVDSKKHE